MKITISILLNQFIITENGKQTILSLEEAANFFKKRG